MDLQAYNFGRIFRSIHVIVFIVFIIIQHLTNLHTFLQDATCRVSPTAMSSLTSIVVISSTRASRTYEATLHAAVRLSAAAMLSHMRTDMVHNVNYARSNRQNGVPIKSVKGWTPRISDPLSPYIPCYEDLNTRSSQALK